MNYVIPVVVLIILIYSYYKKINIYDEFLEGAKEGLITVFKITPAILAFVFAINIFVKSNVLSFILSPLSFIKKYNISLELISMGLLRPISGNASLALMNNIYSIYGVDSFNGFLASVIQGCTDTTIYVLALYFGSINITNSRYALFVGLFADFCGIMSAIVVSLIFYN